MAGGLLGGLVGLLTGGSMKEPKVDSSAATKELDDEEAKAKKARSALLEAGSGSQLQPGQVGGGGDRVFGN